MFTCIPWHLLHNKLQKKKVSKNFLNSNSQLSNWGRGCRNSLLTAQAQITTRGLELAKLGQSCGAAPATGVLQNHDELLLETSCVTLS